MHWKEKARQLYKDYGNQWARIAEEMVSFFPGRAHYEIKEKVRSYLRRAPEFKSGLPTLNPHSSIEYRQDGTTVSEKFITLRDGEDMTPEVIMHAHGLDTSRWEIVSYKNNFWNSQIAGGARQISYQSKVTVRPRTNLSFDDVDRMYKKLCADTKPFAVKETYKPGGVEVEINVADLHVGKLCRQCVSGVDYNLETVKEVFADAMCSIVMRIKDLNPTRIVFAWANDFFHTDTAARTTTGGTPQDVDGLSPEMFDVGVELLTSTILMLREVCDCAVHTFYTRSNHDEITGYHAAKLLEAFFRNDPLVTVDTRKEYRKYMLIGKTLVGYGHGDSENSKGTKDKASRLASCMPIEAQELWSLANFREFHCGHLHSEQLIAEINGVLVRRISSPTATDAWHAKNGFIGSVRKIQTFVYDPEHGITDIINTPVV